MRTVILVGAACLVALACPAAALAQAPAADSLPFILNSLFLLVCGVLVMFMAAGFAMLEAGSVRAKSVSAILIKNISLFAIAAIMFYLVGYNLLFDVAPGGVFGTLTIWTPDAADASDPPAYAANAIWFFQMVFVATAASVVSGSLAERIRLWPFLLFTAALTGFVYPIVGSWTWGGGWLATLGFTDFAGSTIVHSVGGWAALAGAILLGPRTGRFAENGSKMTMPYASSPQITIGVMILWFGWFGFNGGSQLSFSSMADADTVANIFANTNAAAAGGVIAALIFTRLIRGKPDLLLTLNGALAGLVAITAEPAAPTIGLAAIIGAAGAMVMIGAAALLERLKIDDVVGAVPVHLAAGLFGTLVAGVTHEGANPGVQLLGIVTIGLFTFLASFAIWFLLRKVMGIRLCARSEAAGADLSELGARAYNLGPEDDLLARRAGPAATGGEA